jgi:hypothetical protein
MSGAVGASRAESQAVTLCPHRALAALWHVIGYRHSLRQALKRTIITFKVLVLLLPRA